MSKTEIKTVYGYDGNVYELSIHGNCQSKIEATEKILFTGRNGKTYLTALGIVEYIKENDLTKCEIVVTNAEATNKLSAIKKNCLKSIASINEKLNKKEYGPNRYQEIRLRAFKTKCKEILSMIEE